MRKYFFILLILAAFPILTAVNVHAQRAYGTSRIGYDPVSRVIFGYSRTELDYYAGSYYDPYVVGSLYGQHSFFRLDGGADQGFQNYIPAEVFTSSNTTPLTRYDVVSDHYLITLYLDPYTCDYYGYNPNCGYDPWGYGFLGGIWDGGWGNFWGPGGGFLLPNRTIYLGSTGISAITPPDDPCNSTYGDAYEYDGSSSTYRDTEYLPSAITACPSPTPTPTITAQVTEVGFTGDEEVKKFNHGNSPQPVLNPPNTHTATWKRSHDPKLPVAYQKDQQPTMWATLMLSPAVTSSTSARIQVKKGGTVIATKDVNLLGANVRIDDISTTALENPAVVKKGEYKFVWEISFDSGSTWKPMGQSSHKIFWTWGASLQPEFTDPKINPATGEFNSYTGLFDVALEYSAGKMGQGSSDLDEIIYTITKAQAKAIFYDPGLDAEARHPLKDVEERQAVCASNSHILRGLLRSIGIDGQVLYYYGGNKDSKHKYRYTYGKDDKTFQILRDPKTPGNVSLNPHFSYHSVVKAGEHTPKWLYDASYGRRDESITFNETYCPPCSGHFASGSATANYTVENTFLTDTSDTNGNQPCPHEIRRLAFPNQIDDAETYVAQQYWDLLNRAPDSGGLNFWTSQITNCGSDSGCISYMRTQVAKSFFLSREFQATGMYVYYLYKASFLRPPTNGEFAAGQSNVGDGFVDGTPGCDTVLENNQAAFAEQWVQTDDFAEQYDGLANEAYVDTLYSNIGVSPGFSERQSLLDGLNNGTQTRAGVLRYIISNLTFQAAEDHPAFVLMEYFGYLRRNPDDPPDNDMSGYNFWLGQYNTYNDQNSMVTAFVTSSEYRSRFGEP